MLSRIKSIMLTVILLASAMPSQCAPRWTTQTPIGKNHVYAVGVGEAASLYEARRLSISDAMSVFSEQQNISIKSRFHSLSTEDRRQIEDEVSIKGASTTLKGLRLTETYVVGSSGRQQVWSLMSLPSANEIGRWSAIWRSALLPGWGQFYQGKNWRGAVFLAGGVLGVGGALYTASRQQDFENQGQQSTVPATRHYYYDQADKYHQGNVAFVTLTITSYALSLADAIFTSSNKADIYYAFGVNPDGRVALRVSLR
jgi:hypothetical protein